MSGVRSAWRRSLAAFSVFLVTSLPLSLGAALEEGKRVALIIGNDAYTIRALQNAVNDARAMDKALREAGFRTILKENATKAVMEEAVAELLDSVGPGDTVLFFYAGHAIQIQNENVLVPVDFESAKTLIQAKLKSFSLAMVFDYLKQSRAQRTIVIIDACRSNPVREQYSLQGGLAIPLTPGKESYIAYSTSPNRVAADNPDGKNSWFSEALASQIAQPALTIDEVFTRVRLHVEKATGGAQTPWSLTNLTSPFHFHPPQGLAGQTDAGLTGKWLEDAATQERRGNWSEALALLNRVAGQQPAGSLQQKARDRLPYVTARNTAGSRYEAKQFAEAAGAYEQALRLDPFAMDAAFEGVNSYLLTEQVPQAVALLKAIRVRGASAGVERATAMLKELSPISEEAAQEIKSTAVEPPGIKELFTGARFGVPDWEAGRRYGDVSPMEMARWANEMTAALPTPAVVQSQTQGVVPQVAPPEAPASPAPAAAAEAEPAAAEPAAPAGEAQTAITLDSFHVEIVSLEGTRDLVFEKLDELKDFGTLILQGSRPNTSVVLAGKVISRLPAKVRLRPGKYEIRAIERGKKLRSSEVQVRSGSIVMLTFD